MSLSYQYLENFARESYTSILNEVFYESITLIIVRICFNESINKEFKTVPFHLLLPLDKEEDNRQQYQKWSKAIQYAFDVNCEGGDRIMYHIENRDFLWRTEESSHDNYLQWISNDTKERIPIVDMIYYLFKNVEYYWNEPHELDKEEKQLRKNFYKYIKNKYPTAKDYTKSVDTRLFNKGTISGYEETISKKVYNISL